MYVVACHSLCRLAVFVSQHAVVDLRFFHTFPSLSLDLIVTTIRLCTVVICE